MAETSNEIDLRNALMDVHALSSGSLSRIRAIARCALRALETPRGVRDLESIAGALTAIAQDADIVQNDIDVTAGEYGLQTIDEAWSNRLDAMFGATTVPAGKGGAQ